MNISVNTYTVRVVTIGGQRWFVAEDVCDLLGISHGCDAGLEHTEDIARAAIYLNNDTLDQNIINVDGLKFIVEQSL